MTPHREFGHADDCPHKRRNWDATAPDPGEHVAADPDCVCGRAVPHAHCAVCGHIVWFQVGKYSKTQGN